MVFVSTANARIDRLWAKKQGARELLNKPVDSAQIVSNLKRYA